MPATLSLPAAIVPVGSYLTDASPEHRGVLVRVLEADNTGLLAEIVAQAGQRIEIKPTDLVDNWHRVIPLDDPVRSLRVTQLFNRIDNEPYGGDPCFQR